MVIVIFSITLLIAFEIYKFIGKEQYMTREKPVWKKLIYWGSMLFISLIFNVIMYSGNVDNYRVANYLNKDNLDVITFLILCCLTIQVVSPSLFGGKIVGSGKALLRRINWKNPSKKETVEEEGLNLHKLSSVRETNIYPVKNTKIYQEKVKGLQEKYFEIFLNTLCWLIFSYVIAIEIFYNIASNNLFQSMSKISSDFQGSLYDTLSKQLNSIASIMLIFTLPIVIRQVLFYLIKLRTYEDAVDKNQEHYSARYEKYSLIQKHLNKANKRL